MTFLTVGHRYPRVFSLKMTGERKYVVMAIKYFSKWPEAEAIKNITAYQMIDFVLGNIICRFGIQVIFI